jgi:hypothetical protein
VVVSGTQEAEPGVRHSLEGCHVGNDDVWFFG